MPPGSAYGRAVHLLVDRARLALTLALPGGPVRGGCVALHPAGDGSRRQPLLQHLAEVLPQHGVAVLLHDRRPAAEGQDVPLEVQADDALAVAEELRSRVGPVPVGMWGWSQGAWAAPLAASRDPRVAFLVLVASVGVSPAAQMLYGTAEHLRRAGYDEPAVARLLQARRAYEAALRGSITREAAQDVLDGIAAEPWWHLAWLPERMEPADSWPDMDLDPGPVFAATRCPVLAVWGEDDPWLPVSESESVWRQAAGDRLTVLRLPGVGHGPTPTNPAYAHGLVAHVAAAVRR